MIQNTAEAGSVNAEQGFFHTELPIVGNRNKRVY